MLCSRSDSRVLFAVMTQKIIAPREAGVMAPRHAAEEGDLSGRFLYVCALMSVEILRV